jgi:hypothetical protein
MNAGSHASVQASRHTISPAPAIGEATLTAGTGPWSVPLEFLEPPTADDRRYIDRDEAAQLLDAFLGKLARQESISRLQIGRLAATLLDCRAYHDLGFARLSDYSRERLGLSARELQSLATVHRRLLDLPRCRYAFEHGHINWTRLRLIVQVASPGDEQAWLALARDDSVATLAVRIREHIRAGGDSHQSGSGAPELSDSTAAHADPISPPSGPPCAPPAAAHEPSTPPAPHKPPMPSEPANARTHPIDESNSVLSLRCPEWLRLLWRDTMRQAAKVAGAELAPSQAMEIIAAEAISGRSPAAETAAPSTRTPAFDPARSFARRPPGLTVVPLDDGDDETTASCQTARAYSVAGCDFDDHDLEALRSSVGTSASPRESWLEMSSAIGDPARLSTHELDRTLRSTIATMQRIDAQLGRLLYTFVDMRLFFHVGFRSSAAYVTDRLGMSASKARGLLRIERRSLHSGSELATAYRDGSLTWLRCLILVPVVTDTNARPWIERARNVTVRRLADEVEWALHQQACADLCKPTFPPEPDALPPSGEATEARSAISKLEQQIGARWKELPAPDPTGSLSPHGWWAESDAVIRLSGPASLVDFIAETIDAFTYRGEHAWAGLYRMLAAARDEWRILPRHRNPIFDRDGWRCRVPACSARRNLQEHHLVFRSRGGGNERSNRIAVCAWHHLRGIHAGTVRAHGDAEHAVDWELGPTSDNGALMKLTNDYYRDSARG